MELYGRIRRACHVEGMSIREAARLFGLHRDTVRKMLRYSVAPGYQRRGLPRRPKLDPYKGDRKSTRLNSSHVVISYAVFCLKNKKNRLQ